MEDFSNWADERGWVWLYEKPWDAWDWLGCKLFGHQPDRDQCDIPAHDHCIWCNKSMPNQAPGRET